MSSRKQIYEIMYKRATDESQLEWHREEIPMFVGKAVAQVVRRGKALDLGCGTGVHSLYLAQQGFRVTAIDFVSSALDFARKRANEAGVEIQFVHADILEWETPDHFDLIIDSGCLHSMRGDSRKRYKVQLLKWLDPSSLYGLLHFAKRHFFDFGLVGPQRKTREDIERFFAPELRLTEFYAETGKKPLNQYLFLAKDQ
ncbi:MAG: class I SAM-dependent methyltransferase [Chloroflexi bacterium]|nr:class I SAM-dependent methyltransferase [Chloroflexota bacterium]